MRCIPSCTFWISNLSATGKLSKRRSIILSSADVQAWPLKEFRSVALFGSTSTFWHHKGGFEGDHACRSKELLQNVPLPPKFVTIVECQFDAAEHAFYNALAQKLGSWVDNLQHMEKHWPSLMAMLLRLRQGMLSHAITPQFVVHPTENHSM